MKRIELDLDLHRIPDRGLSCKQPMEGSLTNAQPTPFRDLNALLVEFVRRVGDLLGDNLVGAYLQGSFAVGDFDDHSDVDFLMVVREDIAEEDLAGLQAIHKAIHGTSSSTWARHLEGSYTPLEILRRWAETPRDPPGHPPRPSTWADPGTGGMPPRVYPFLFLDHGSDFLVRSEHDNTRVVRWVAREKGIILTGPQPAELIDSVSATDLRVEMHEVIETLATTWLMSPSKMDQRWLPDFFVVLYCRMLHTLETGKVASKKAGTIWAKSHLESRWHPLIERAWRSRHTPERWLERPDPDDVRSTIAFMEYMTDRSRNI